LGSGSSVTDGTLYGAIYAAEYMMRMSSVPSMLYVGMHALSGTRGVSATETHYNDCTAAYDSGTTIDTLGLNFGFFTTAQPLGLAVLNGFLKNATEVLATTVTGGATVLATGVGQIPALFAQAYASGWDAGGDADCRGGSYHPEHGFEPRRCRGPDVHGFESGDGAGLQRGAGGFERSFDGGGGE
jgi:hypothetical protein